MNFGSARTSAKGVEISYASGGVPRIGEPCDSVNCRNGDQSGQEIPTDYDAALVSHADGISVTKSFGLVIPGRWQILEVSERIDAVALARDRPSSR